MKKLLLLGFTEKMILGHELQDLQAYFGQQERKFEYESVFPISPAAHQERCKEADVIGVMIRPTILSVVPDPIALRRKPHVYFTYHPESMDQPRVLKQLFAIELRGDPVTMPIATNKSA